MIIETFLTNIAAAIFKKAVIGNALVSAATAYEIYSVFDAISDVADCVEATSDCSDLCVCGNVIVGQLTEAAADRLLEFGSDRFIVEKTASGIYVASNVVKTFQANSLVMPSVRVRNISGVRVEGQPKVRT